MACTDSLLLDLSGLVDRIIERGLNGLPIEEQLAGFAELINLAGFPMKRASIGMRTLHPQFGALTYIWRPDEDRVEYSPQKRTVQELAAFRQSPVNFMLKSGETTLRHRLDSGEELAFPILEKLRGEGMTDYAAGIVRYDTASHGSSALEGVFFSCATDDPAGFHTGQLQQVFELLPYFAIAVKSRLTYDVASTVTKTYLGKDAGRRVLTGEIERGTTQTIKAVIWYFDLQGFTNLAETTPGEQMIAMLDEYFGAVVGAVEAYGGDVLKFMGDGLLAIFKFSDDGGACCSRAIGAADELLGTMATINNRRKAEGLVLTNFSLALHLGDLMYGNIGSEDRLDFTVIGPAVNMVARIQAMCRPLEQDLIISSAMAGSAVRERKRIFSIGQHVLRGIPEPQELFSLAAAD